MVENNEEITLGTIHEILTRVETQVMKTNGRVRSLEIWRGAITGGLTIISLFVGYIMKKFL